MNKLKAAIAESALGPTEVIAPDKVAKRYCFSAQFLGFSGHFPEYPVLPAFVQIMAALAVAEEWKGSRLEISSVEKAKFHIELRPDQEITVYCKERTMAGAPALEASLETIEGLAASFIIKTIKKD